MKNKELQELKPVYIHETSHSSDDEINLIDLAVILTQRKILIVLIITIFMTLGITKAMLTPKQYTVSTSIEIGSQIIDGDVKSFESPQNLLAKLQHSFIPLTLNTYQLSNPDDTNNYIIRSSVPNSSNMIVLEMSGKEDKIGLMSDFLRETTLKIFQDHKRTYDSVKNNLIALTNQAKTELERLK